MRLVRPEVPLQISEMAWLSLCCLELLPGDTMSHGHSADVVQVS